MDRDCKGIQALDLSGKAIFRGFHDFCVIDLAFSLGPNAI